MKLSLVPFLIFLFGIIFIHCNPSDSTAQDKEKLAFLNQVIMEDSLVMPFPYKLTQPDKKIELPGYLAEVSALGYFPDNQLVMTQDENGIIYVLDLEKEEITGDFRFKNKGDFEGIEVIGNTAYVLRSDGVIYEVPNFTQDDPETNKFETSLSERDDTEGFGFDPATQTLLIACKEATRKGGEKIRYQRSVIGFDLQSLQALPDPYMTIDLREIQAFLLQHAEGEDGLADARAFDPEKGGSLKPSGIAVHPISGYIFVIASNGQRMVVFNQKHQVVQVQKLPREIFGQPEGICFNPKGDLFISNEGRSGKGNVLMFTYQSNK